MKPYLRSLSLFLSLVVVTLLAFGAQAAKKKRSATNQTVTNPSFTVSTSSLPNCTLPGVQVLTDPANDQNGNQVGGPTQQLDLLGVYFAELGTDTNAITVTIKVQNLTGTLFPNGTWQVYMNVKDTTGTLRTIFVNMNTTDNPPSAAFNFGYNSSLNGTGNDTSQGTAGVVTGSFTTDGTITIKLHTANIISFNDISAAHQFDVDLRQPGVSLSGINAVTTALVGVLGNGVTTTVDTATTGTTSYLTVGNAACSGAPTPTPTPTPTGTPTPSPTPTPTPAGTPTPTPSATPVSVVGTPRFQIYMSPQGVGESAGEPSLGSNWTKEAIDQNHNINGTVNNIPNGGTSLYFGGFLSSMLKVTWDDCSSPAGNTWDQKPLVSASTPRAAGDPILFTDHVTGRTFVAQLEGLTPAGATIDITDNDGDSFTPSDGVIPSDVDHETLGGGIYHAPLTGGVDPIYPDVVYYASQSITDARCLRSDTGGLVFSQATTPMFTAADCAGLHGHVKVSPADGTAYVPDFACGGSLPFHNGGQQAVAVSEDNGLTWTVRTIPDSSTSGVIQEPVVPGTAQTRDPSVAIATDGTVYFVYQAANGHSMVAVSHNKGVDWAPSVDVGANVINGGPVLNATFVAAVAGDPDRAAVTFMGTETGGNNWDCGNGNTCDYGPDFTGVWYLYIAATYDGGHTWITQNVTPGDPVQRGGICGGGTCRNLLDFMDATIDKDGRILVGYDDGCITASCIDGGPNDYTAKAAIARQSGGKRMYSANDPNEPLVAGAPRVTGTLNGNSATLTWPVPDNSGAAITGYNIYRKVGTGAFVLLANVKTTAFTDPNFAAGDVYHVTALNSKGEGPYCADVTPVVVPAPNPCVLPGVLALVDNDGDAAPNTPPDSRVDVQQLFVAEPLFTPAADKMVFTLQVGTSTAGAAPASSQWYIVWNRQGTDPTDSSDASYDRMYVAMKTDVTGAVSFDYGKFGIPLNEVPPPPPDPNANTPKSYGAPDSGSYDPATGIVRITISNNKYRAIDGGSGKYVAGTGLSALNVRTYLARPDAGQKSQNNANDITPNGSYTLAGNASCASNVLPILSVVSAKTHGSAGEFDIPLPYTGNTASVGIECRSGGSNNSHTVVFSFVNPLASVGNAQIVSGTANIDSANSGINPSNPHEYIVTLTGVANAQRVVIKLSNVADTAGNTAATLSTTLSVLLGDTTANGAVNSSDIAQTQAQSGQALTESNFREDVTANGAINSSDISLVQSKSGTGLP
ncbi:MAG TPA: hypothetical protein VLK27_08280 [Chthoniobacterales bacterium]|nr:hypothetical protein [Chthoniobacterales bacterium]